MSQKAYRKQTMILPVNPCTKNVYGQLHSAAVYMPKSDKIVRILSKFYLSSVQTLI